jgi:hypothetical protein
MRERGADLILYTDFWLAHERLPNDLTDEVYDVGGGGVGGLKYRLVVAQEFDFLLTKQQVFDYGYLLPLR